MGEDREDTHRLTFSLDQWRSLLAWLLLAAVVVTGVGECISAAGAPEIGVVNTWGRIDEATSRVVSWQYALVLLAVLALALTEARRRRIAPAAASDLQNLLFAVVGVASLAALGAILGAIAVVRRIADEGSPGFDPPTYYSSTEQVGGSIVFFGMLVVLVAIAVAAFQNAATERDANGPAPTA